MRQDIQISIETHDVVISPKNEPHIDDFKWVTYKNGLEHYIYGEVCVPSFTNEDEIRSNGIFFTIPYTPKYKMFYLSIKHKLKDGRLCYLINKKTGDRWFLARRKLYGGVLEDAFASQLIQISDTSLFGAIKEEHNQEYIELYSSAQSDFNIIPAQRQNANCMLACLPSNNYRYPVTGVGLLRWLNSSDINSGDLANVLQREFSRDGVNVVDAVYDYVTHCMTKLDLQPLNEDE